MTKTNGVMTIEEVTHSEPLRLLILFDKNCEDICRVFGDVLGQSHNIATNVGDASGSSNDVVVGLESNLVFEPELLRSAGRIVVATHCLEEEDLRDENMTAYCDYEYLYPQKNPMRRDVARFLGFILGQFKPHDDLCKKARTTLLSTTFPDIRTALPNLDILSVGADSVELRVDLLKEHGENAGPIPSINYVGEQVMLLRQRTELPIVFTTRCTKENGLFPMDNPELTYRYLHKAIQWGCEYIDVELWLPEDIRRKLSLKKGNSKIISAWHDFSGTFNWSSDEAQQIFQAGAVYGDIVKMIALVNTMEDNYKLEYFRSVIQSTYAHPPLSGLNMGPIGQLSRTLNRIFTPITHPLLPMIAAPGQLSVAEINSMLHSMGQLPALDIYAVGNVSRNGQAMFFEKCLNELSLPHHTRCVEHGPKGTIEPFFRHENFGGAYISPPLPAGGSYLSNISMAATTIGQIDSIVSMPTTKGKSLMGDNTTWKGIRATLTRDFVPSAYNGRPALVLASSEAQAAAAIYALMSLDVGPIYTIGCKTKGPLGSNVQQFVGFEEMMNVEEPFVIISALPADKSFVVLPLLKFYSSGLTQKSGKHADKVFVDLSNGVSGKGDSVATARLLGWTTYGIADVNAWTTVETLRLLVGQNVPFDFVRLAAGRSLYQ